jgi:N-acetylglutamate synthase-like GNAT family acetyltransferase
MIQIVSAESGETLEHAISLSQEYVTWMIAEIRTQFPELSLAEFISEHQYDDVRKKYPGEHVPPYGCLLVALNDDQVSGCVALGRLSKEIGEMRTLFVRPEFRGTGVGKQLAEASLDQARKIGYRCVRLDTLGFMESALRLYRSLGFYEIEPYHDIPASQRQYIRFLERDLSV